MSNIILVEGPDGSGKTTLCNVLVNNYHYQYVHLSKLDDSITVDEFYEKFYDELKKIKNLSLLNINLVVDRSFISNVIYSHVFKEDETISEDFIENYLKKLFDKVVICLPDRDSYFKKFNELKNERFELYDNMENVYNLYEALFDKSNKIHNLIENMNVKRYNMNVVNDINNYVKEEVLNEENI